MKFMFHRFEDDQSQINQPFQRNVKHMLVQDVQDVNTCTQRTETKIESRILTYSPSGAILVEILMCTH